MSALAVPEEAVMQHEAAVRVQVTVETTVTLADIEALRALIGAREAVYVRSPQLLGVPQVRLDGPVVNVVPVDQ